MPKAASDALLTCTVKPIAVAGDAAYWQVHVSEYSERFMLRPDPDWVPEPPSDPGQPNPYIDTDHALQPDPYIEAAFKVAQYNGMLGVVLWSITGSEIISTRKARIPLKAWANAALIAVEDAVHATWGRSSEEIVAEGQTYVSALEISNGRLVDPKTREHRKPAPRPRLAAADGKRVGLELDKVAESYRTAVRSGSRSATADVARAFHVGRSTAARAIADARREGLLGPALRNAAGEQT